MTEKVEKTPRNNGRLTNKEKVYLDKYREKGAEYLAKRLKRNKKCIEAYLGIAVTKEAPQVDPALKKEKYIDNLFAKKESHGVVVMTEAASMYMDKQRESRKSNGIDSSCIHRPKD